MRLPMNEDTKKRPALFACERAWGGIESVGSICCDRPTLCLVVLASGSPRAFLKTHSCFRTVVTLILTTVGYVALTYNRVRALYEAMAVDEEASSSALKKKNA